MAGNAQVAPLVVSRAADIKRQRQVLELPIAQDGVTIVIEIGAVPVPQLMGAMDGVPGANAAPSAERVKTLAEAREEILQFDGPSKRVAALGILAPEFSFDAREDGKAFWDDLIGENQGAAIAAIMELSGLKGGAAKQAGTFPPGAGDGAGVGTPNG